MPAWLRGPAVGDALLVAGFLVCLWLPLADVLLGLERPPRIVEKRVPAAPPHLALTWRAVAELPRGFEAYWNDRFGFRRTLIRAHAVASLQLGVSPSERVVFGTSGWLFLEEEFPQRNPLERRPLSEEQFDHWRRVLERRRDALAVQGAHYLLVVVPNKSTIYPEYLPEGLAPPGTPTDLDRLMRHMRDHPGVDVLDLRGALLEAKRGHLVYHPADTHWNDIGAHAAYAAIIARLAPRFPGMAPAPLSSFDAVPGPVFAGDLAEMVGLREYFGRETTKLRPLEPRQARPASTRIPGQPGGRRSLATELSGVARPRALAFIDSFGRALQPYLSEHFARVVYVRRPDVDPAAVALERPDVVIHEVAERLLKWAFLSADQPVGGPPPR